MPTSQALAEELNTLDAKLDRLTSQHAKRLRERSVSGLRLPRCWLPSPAVSNGSRTIRRSAAQAHVGIVRENGSASLERGGDRSATEPPSKPAVTSSQTGADLARRLDLPLAAKSMAEYQQTFLESYL